MNLEKPPGGSRSCSLHGHRTHLTVPTWPTQTLPNPGPSHTGWEDRRRASLGPPERAQTDRPPQPRESSEGRGPASGKTATPHAERGDPRRARAPSQAAMARRRGHQPRAGGWTGPRRPHSAPWSGQRLTRHSRNPRRAKPIPSRPRAPREALAPRPYAAWRVRPRRGLRPSAPAGPGRAARRLPASPPEPSRSSPPPLPPAPSTQPRGQPLPGTGGK